MKKLSLIFLSALLVFTLAACGKKCEHTYDNACDAICNQCEETREVGAHDFAAADCDTAKTCTVCGATEGEALGHTWADADCDTPKTCTVCGNNYGTVNANAHAYGDITYVWTDEYTKCTATRTCSHNAAHKETETVTTTQNGKIFTAVFENAAFGTATIDPSVQIGGVTVKPWEEVPPIDVGEAEEVN